MVTKNRPQIFEGHSIEWPSVVFLLAALALWLVPFFHSGWKGRTWGWLPRSMSFQHTAAGLFTKRSTRWWEQHLEAVTGEGAKAQARELDEWALFPMGAFGYRTRYDRLMIETGRSPHVLAIRQRLAEHALTRMKTLGQPLPEELRLVRSYWTVGSPTLAEPAGLWTTPPIPEITGRDREVLGAYRLKNGVLELMPRARSTPVVAQRSAPAKPTPNVKTPAVSAPGLFQRPGAPPPPPARNQITRRQVQRLVTPGLKPGAVLPGAGKGSAPAATGLRPQLQDVSRLKLGQPGVPIQKMPKATTKGQ